MITTYTALAAVRVLAGLAPEVPDGFASCPLCIQLLFPNYLA